ncbi:MAG: LysM peptidoglycan-binding domain-containing protein [Treponema sp.]|nr:LysM peptidoglycan-binding domain-containing protein [Treponema sp.]
MNPFRQLIVLAFLLVPLSFGPLAAETVHIVVRGDTIFSLARTHGVSQEELMGRNGLKDPSQLKIGMRLTIPTKTVPSAAPGTQYRVLPGDTLFSIARNRGVTVQTLREANGFSQDRMLLAGELIRIPGSGSSGTVAQAESPSGTSRPSVSGTAVTTTTQAARPAAPQAPRTQAAGRRADPALGWPISSTDILYMENSLGGVLIAGRQFDSVRSLSRGTVVYAGPWRGYGKVAIVEAGGGFRFLYGANETLSVMVGDIIEKGTEIGKLGLHPSSGRPELVFIVSKNGTPVDPATAPREG